jgi:L-alanine-DL-glutamate epimerase-like enolase superfamily enzyme
VPVIIDFNCSATSDEDVLEQVTLIGSVASIDAVEQPFGVGNLVDHARLATRLDVALSLDESVRSLRDLTNIANYKVATMICVKPARVGGLSNARALIARANELGLRSYLGGFFESPYARGVHRALANSCVNEPSDLDNVSVGRGDEGTEVTSVSSSFGFEPSARVLASAARRPISSEIQP